jgi:hypothetical protein
MNCLLQVGQVKDLPFNPTYRIALPAGSALNVATGEFETFFFAGFLPAILTP